MTGALQLDFLSRWLTCRLRPELRFFRRSISAYQVCGVAGLLCAIALASSLALRRGLELQVIAILLAGAVAAFFALVIVLKIVTGRETLVYYQHEIAVLAQAALLARLLGRPVLPYLDIAAIAVGCFLAFGRVGCLMVGCCHGRPAHSGIRYGQAHAEAGFPRSLLGVPLVPVQALEAGLVFLIVLADAVWLARGSKPGEAFASYVAAYAAGRFVLEYWRGDPRRPYWKASSAAQWISVASAALVACEEFAGRLPFHSWHIGVATLLAALALWNALRDTGRRRILRARHIGEIADALSRLSTADSDAPGIPVAGTSLGVRISSGRFHTAEGQTHHYTFSQRGRDLTADDARHLAVLTRHLRGHAQPCLVARGANAAWHIVFGDTTADSAPVLAHTVAGFPLSGRPAR